MAAITVATVFFMNTRKFTGVRAVFPQFFSTAVLIALREFYTVDPEIYML